MIGLKFEFEINNFSGLMEVSAENLPKYNLNGIYFLYNESKELIYVGKSSNCITTRLRQHFFYNNYYYEDDYNKRLIFEKRKHFKYFAFSIITNDLIEIAEIFLIKKFKPRFNKNFNEDYYNPPYLEETQKEIKKQKIIDNIYMNL